MVTWLTRSLLFIVVGAVLAYAVTVHNDTIDIQTAGVIILLVGIFDLLLNIAITLYYRDSAWPHRDPRPYPADPAQVADRATGHRHPDDRATGRRYPDDRATGHRYPDDRATGHRYPDDRAHPDDDTHATRPIRHDEPASGDRDHPPWH